MTPEEQALERAQMKMNAGGRTMHAATFEYIQYSDAEELKMLLLNKEVFL